VSDILRKAHQQSMDSKGQYSVAYYFEQELMEAFQETLPGNKQGNGTTSSNGSQYQSRIGNGKLAQTVGAVGKSNVDICFRDLMFLFYCFVTLFQVKQLFQQHLILQVKQ
jgi:hypothetical protein